MYGDVVAQKEDPRGRPFYLIGGGKLMWLPGRGTDFEAIEQGYVSVTPLRYELTDLKALEGVEHMLRGVRLPENEKGGD